MFNMGPSECLNDNSFGPHVLGCRDDFDFTLQFEQIFLSILPACIFMSAAFVRLVMLVRRPTMVGGFVFCLIKLLLTIIYAVLELVILSLAAAHSGSETPLLVASTALSFVASLFITALSFLEHTRSPRPSVLLSVFLPLTLLFDIVQVRSLWLSAYTHDERTFVGVFTAALAVKAVMILLESRHKTKWMHWEGKDHSPEETSGLWGLSAFVWLNSLFFTGFRKVLNISDLFPLDSAMAAEKLHAALSERLARSTPGKKNRLMWALGKTLLVPLLLPVVGRIALVGFSFCQPFLIQSLLNYLQVPAGEASPNTGYGLIGATVLVYAGKSISTALYWYFQERAMFMARGCLASAVYKKTTQSKLSAADDAAAITLMSTDVERIRLGFLFLHEAWSCTVQVVLSLYFLQVQLGAAFAAPIIIVACCAVVEVFVAKFSGPRQKAWMSKIQTRVGLTANVISNMKHLKISGLTEPVEDSIQQLRIEELKSGTGFRMCQVNALLLGFIPLLMAPVFTFAVTSRTLDVTTIFTSTSYLLLLTDPLSFLFQLVPNYMSGIACLQRIQAFLEKEPREDFRELMSATPSEKKMDLEERTEPGPAIRIVNGSFGWVENEFNLKDISAEIPASALTIVVGPIASGKSTLCKVLLGETPFARGQVLVRANHRRIGYCDQVPFLSNATIRDNIVGFSEFDQQRYDEVIDASMLARDLTLLPQGDLSKVGSNGITLSGGQKQRLSIARALYLQADLFIFDDILSGLDADTEEAVFTRVFGPFGLLKKRNATVVLCTHSVRHLPIADHIIALSPTGTLVEEGNFDTLLANKKYVHGLGVERSSRRSETGRSTPSVRSEASAEMDISRQKTAASALEIVPDEASRQLGDSTVYSHYFKSIGYGWLSLFVALGVFTGFLFNFPNIWLNYWSADMSSPHPQRTTSYYAGIYAVFQVLTLACFYGEITLAFKVMIQVSGAALHKSALRTVITAPLRFFTTTDSGVVLNFFSQDMTLIDGELPMALVNFSIDFWIALGSMAVIASSSPYVAISYPFVLAILFFIQMFYLRTSRQLRLLDLEAKSPLYTHFLDTIKGVATFRAFGWVQEGIQHNNALLDSSQRPAYLLAMIQRWLIFILNIVIGILALVVTVLATQLRSNTGFTGASLVSLMSLGDGLTNLIRCYTMLETSIGAVARLKTFSEKTAPEDLPGETVVPPESWPETGRIEIKSVSASYADTQAVTEDQEDQPDLALRDLDLTIEPGQKVAICGRSGSGKSSTILLLLRLLDPLPHCAGNMAIDGIPLDTVDRTALRRRVIAVPQDPVFLPDGTSFKTNLDPFGVASAAECQAVLEAVNLWDFVAQRDGLDAGMTPDSLSQGQKQLFSLARAILRRRVRARRTGAGADDEKSSIRGAGVLLLDEVSSSVDVATDKAMQKIIHAEFAGYTIVMVSHRLDMVMDFDQVVVMDAGRVVETGVPRELVEVEASRFRDLWLVGNGK